MEENYNSTERNANQSEVYAKLKKTIKRVHGIPTEVAESTIDNFLTIFREDEEFTGVRFNTMSNRLERVTTEGRRDWSAADDAWPRSYIEKTYDIHSQVKWQDALIQFQREREYNPLQETIDAVTWDGTPRCEQFLVKWMKADDTPYNREVSRLLFAGGINRLYDAGCKFDCVPVLIGSQGGGKSTLCHWLALEDCFYNSISTIEGQKGAEAIQGVWICEFEELLAVLANGKSDSTREEKTKAFISKQDEYYRQPYTKRSEHHYRQCIFIGTTNRNTFLMDKTGARRWFPVRVHSSASDLYDHEDECRADILQAWAEMKAAYDSHDALASLEPRRVLSDAIKTEQAEAGCEDYRVGIIEGYLAGKNRVCLMEVWYEGLAPYNGSAAISTKVSRELAEILVEQLGWERGNAENFGPVYQKQKAFYRPGARESISVA